MFCDQNTVTHKFALPRTVQALCFDYLHDIPQPLGCQGSCGQRRSAEPTTRVWLHTGFLTTFGSTETARKKLSANSCKAQIAPRPNFTIALDLFRNSLALLLMGFRLCLHMGIAACNVVHHWEFKVHAWGAHQRLWVGLVWERAVNHMAVAK